MLKCCSQWLSGGWLIWCQFLYKFIVGNYWHVNCELWLIYLSLWTTFPTPKCKLAYSSTPKFSSLVNWLFEITKLFLKCVPPLSPCMSVSLQLVTFMKPLEFADPTLDLVTHSLVICMNIIILSLVQQLLRWENEQNLDNLYNIYIDHNLYIDCRTILCIQPTWT